MDSIFDSLNMAYRTTLGEGMPTGTLLDLKKDIVDSSEKLHYYFVTITVDDKFKWNNKLFKKIVINRQLEILRSYIFQLFKGFQYFGAFEVHKNRNVIHAHMLCAHPHIHIENSIVKSSIKQLISEFGKMNNTHRAVDTCRNINNTIDYILKEQQDDYNTVFFNMLK